MAMAPLFSVTSSLIYGNINTHADRASLLHHTGISGRQNAIRTRAPSPSINISRHLVQRKHAAKCVSNATTARDRLAPELEKIHGEEKQGSLPVIDMEKLRRGGDERKEVMEEIGRACEEWGLFYVVNHGIGEKVIENMWEAARALISYTTNELSPQERARLQSNVFPREMRERFSDMEFVSKFNALTSKRTTVQFEPLDPDDGEASPALQWTPIHFRAPTCEFYGALMNVGIEFLEGISESLGMPKDSIYEITGSNRFAACAMHCYSPSVDTATLAFRPHKDPGTLTVLFPDPHVTGLQVLKDQDWVDVKPIQGSLVINLGRTMEILTNGKYKGCVHRVTMSNAASARISIPCFLLPTDDSLVGPLPRFIDEQNPAQYPHQLYEDLTATAFGPVIHLVESS